MTRPAASRRPASGSPAVKLLITAAALAATVGGWAIFTMKEVATAATQPAVGLTLDLPPMPTLVPPPDMTGPVISRQPLTPRTSLRSVSAPVTVGQLRPITVTRSSR